MARPKALPRGARPQRAAPGSALVLGLLLAGSPLLMVQAKDAGRKKPALRGFKPGPVMDKIVPGRFLVDPPTLENLGFRWYVQGDSNRNATLEVAFRKPGAAEWRPAPPMLRIHHEIVNKEYGPYRTGNLFAGSVLFLQPATAYEVRFVMKDPDGGAAPPRTVTVKTRAVPAAPEARRTRHLYPPGFKGEQQAPAFDTLQAAVAGLKAGDLLLVHPGVHAGGVKFAPKGTAQHPIVIRGAGGGESVIQAPQGKQVFNLYISGSEHLFIENLTLKGGTHAIRAGESREPGSRFLVVRRCTILEVRTGIRTYSADSENWYLADNVITGINPAWFPRPKKSYMRPAHTGINLYGRGHVVCHNRIRRFGDGLAIANFGPPEKDLEKQCVAMDFYNNDISEAKDDAIESDYGCHNVRIYRNRCYNAHTGISSQPFYGGPLYLVRNELYGITKLCFKLHNGPAGVQLFHNTSVCAYQAFRSDIQWQNATIRNNLFLGAKRYTLESGSPDPRTTLDYNGWRKTADPNRFFKWYDGKAWTKYATLKAFTKGTGNGRHSLRVDYDAFVKAKASKEGVTYTPEKVDLRLKEGAAPVDRGVRLPGLNDGFLGKAPDLGCFERGAPPPHYGPRALRTAK